LIEEALLWIGFLLVGANDPCDLLLLPVARAFLAQILRRREHRPGRWKLTGEERGEQLGDDLPWRRAPRHDVVDLDDPRQRSQLLEELGKV
jgi:hypothetical protein